MTTYIIMGRENIFSIFLVAMVFFLWRLRENIKNKVLLFLDREFSFYDNERFFLRKSHQCDFLKRICFYLFISDSFAVRDKKTLPGEYIIVEW